MARSLNSQEAEAFDEALLTAQKLILGVNPSEHFLSQDQTTELGPETELWPGDHFHGI